MDSVTSPNFTLDPVIGIEDLSRLLRKTPASILADRSRAPWRLPPDTTPPGSKQPLWLLQDVLDWLAQFRKAATSPPPREESLVRCGAPTKAERVRAAALGLSVREMRQQVGEVQP
ncbi:MAG: hypothetical protein H6943_05085 [Zoogloeaceae bacterium]|nr:hypothetical protein [Zoogloeaceae bacterium]